MKLTAGFLRSPARRGLGAAAAGAALARPRRSKARTTFASPQPAPVARRRQDRGDRVLLVRVPALQRVRAGARGLGEEAARRRRLPARAGVRSARSRSAPSSASTTPSRRSACCRRCTARCSTPIHSERAAPAHARGHRGVRADATASTRRQVHRPPTTRSRCRRKCAAGAPDSPTAYKIDGVPAMGVQGRYYTNGNLANAGRALAGDRTIACSAVVDALIGDGSARAPRLSAHRIGAGDGAAPTCSIRPPGARRGRWHRMACKFHAAMRNRSSPQPASPCSAVDSRHVALRWRRRCSPWRAAPAPGREGRPLQAAERRGRPARHDRPAEPGRRLQRQRGRHQGHDDRSGRSRIEVRERPTATTRAVAFGSPSQHATFRQKRDGADEYIEGEAERLEYDGKSDVMRFVNNAVGAAPARQRRPADEICRQPGHLRQRAPRSSASRRRRRRPRPTRAAGCARC